MIKNFKFLLLFILALFANSNIFGGSIVKGLGIIYLLNPLSEQIGKGLGEGLKKCFIDRATIKNNFLSLADRFKYSLLKNNIEDFSFKRIFKTSLFQYIFFNKILKKNYSSIFMSSLFYYFKKTILDKKSDLGNFIRNEFKEFIYNLAVDKYQELAPEKFKIIVDKGQNILNEGQEKVLEKASKLKELLINKYKNLHKSYNKSNIFKKNEGNFEDDRLHSEEYGINHADNIFYIKNNNDIRNEIKA